MTQPVQPIFILPEDTSRNQGKDAQRTNIAAARAIAQAVRSTLGPKGMDKMLVDSAGEVIVTNDGVTILQEMQVVHPVAKMIVEVAKTQEHMVGDGTTTAVVLAGELLKHAENLLDQQIHPTVITKGYRLAAKQVLTFLEEQAFGLSQQTLYHVALTAMTGKGAESHKEQLARLVVEAMEHIDNLDAVKVETHVGDSVDKSVLIAGVVIDKERVHSEMPSALENVRIALLNVPLEIRGTEIDAKIQITNPAQLNSFLAHEEATLKELVAKIAASGAQAVFCQKGIDELAQHFLAKAGILAARRVRKSDMTVLARATGATIVNSVTELTEAQLGMAGSVQEKKVCDEKMLFVERCAHPKAVTILVKGGTHHVAQETKRAITDALGDVAAVKREQKIVAGAGATEIALAKGLRSFGAQLQGREQLAVLAFADALEIIPRTLAENAGLDPIDMLTALRAAHDRGESTAGLDVFRGVWIDARAEGIVEPLAVKRQAITSAAEVAEMILRIDDVIVAAHE